jgi:hypothetical protein
MPGLKRLWVAFALSGNKLYFASFGKENMNI